MKKATLIFLALLVVLSFYMVIPSTVHASDGGGRQVVKVEHVKVNFNLKPLSAAHSRLYAIGRTVTHHQYHPTLWLQIHVLVCLMIIIVMGKTRFIKAVLLMRNLLQGAHLMYNYHQVTGYQ